MLISAILVTLVGVIPIGAVDSDFTIEDGVLIKYNGESEDVVIPHSVTSIGHHAFGFTYHIDIGAYGKIGSTIYGYPGTAAETYAKRCVEG